MTKPFRTLDDADVAGKRVLLRVDLNVPTENGRVTDATRIERVAATITEIADKGGKVVPARAFRPAQGRPGRGQFAETRRCRGRRHHQAAGRLRDRLHRQTADEAIANMKNGDVLLLENTRFHKGEEKNDPAHVEALAKLGDVYVNDAFSAAHRAHATTEGFAHKLPAYAGRAMQKELEALRLRSAIRSALSRRSSAAPKFDQARSSRQPRQQGRRSHHRRRHGQHLPVRGRQTRRQVALREGSGRHRALDRVGGREG